ncbi:MAG: 2-amino-4-hydroxy-6-hydroxymethyldihydropteridine diphosphokinase [Caldilineaceae bacterium]|nr:2-amino-4-hydroxy-6-hydroxymethyldihydropteridine diphosphokinase [Caldilineaceae bacterium]
MQHHVLILLGSNINRHQNLPAAIHRLIADEHLVVDAVSGIYESAAVGGQSEQPIFSNAAIAAWTDLTPAALRQRLRQIESEMGRVRIADKFAPRPIDLDMALYDDLVTDVDGSEIPDPDIERRAHVALPLAEIAPDAIHPIQGRSLKSIAETLDCSHIHVIAPPITV